MNWANLELGGGVLVVTLAILYILTHSEMIGTWVRVWQDFLDSLNTDGGHIFLLTAFVILGIVGAKLAFPKADDLYLLATGSLFALLKTAGSNKTRRDRPTPTGSATTEETTTTLTATESATKEN